MQIIVSIEITSPISNVFTYLTDTDKLMQWQTFLAEAEQLTDGSIGVGSKFRNVLRHPGFDTSGIVTLELVGEVLLFEPDKHLKIRVQSNIADLTIDYVLNQIQDQTTVKQIADFQLKGFLLRPISHMLSGFLTEQFQADLMNLKELVEKNKG